MTDPDPAPDRPQDGTGGAPSWRRVRPSGEMPPEPVDGDAGEPVVSPRVTPSVPTATPAVTVRQPSTSAASSAGSPTPPSASGAGRTGAADAAAAVSAAPTGAPTRRRKAWLIALIAVVVVAAGILVAVLLTREQPVPDPVVLDPIPGEIVTAPVPTPEIAPVERDKSTAILAAVPDTVLRWAVVSQTPNDLAAEQGVAGTTKLPLEAYTLAYSDGTQELLLGVTVWRSPQDAQQAMAAAQWAGTQSEVADVVAGGQVVGTMFSVESDQGQDVFWTNGSTQLVLRAPAGDALPFYDALGL